MGFVLQTEKLILEETLPRRPLHVSKEMAPALQFSAGSSAGPSAVTLGHRPAASGQQEQERHFFWCQLLLCHQRLFLGRGMQSIPLSNPETANCILLPLQGVFRGTAGLGPQDTAQEGQACTSHPPGSSMLYPWCLPPTFQKHLSAVLSLSPC